MPGLSRFAGIVICLLFKDIRHHNKPYVHVYCGEYEASVGAGGELLAGSLPRRQLKVVVGWLALQEEEVYAAWNQAVQGGHFEKIAPMWGARMCEADGICYASSSAQDVRVVSAKPLQGGMLLVGFSSGEERLFDTTSLEGPAFEPLRDEAVLAGPKVEHGFVSWADGQVDVAPEYMYEHSAPYNRRRDWLLAG